MNVERRRAKVQLAKGTEPNFAEEELETMKACERGENLEQKNKREQKATEKTKRLISEVFIIFFSFNLICDFLSFQI
jgi:hypothetical protein